MPTNQIYKPNRNNSKIREVGHNVPAGTPVLIDGRPGVTDAASSQSEATETFPGFSITYPTVGVGYPEEHALVHFDGTFELDIDGVTTSTAQGAEVHYDGGDLNVNGTGDFFGLIDYPTDYVKKDDRAPVQIGVVIP